MCKPCGLCTFILSDLPSAPPLQVISGCAIIVRGQPRGGPPPERQINLSNIRAGNLARRAAGGLPEAKDIPDEVGIRCRALKQPQAEQGVESSPVFSGTCGILSRPLCVGAGEARDIGGRSANGAGWCHPVGAGPFWVQSCLVSCHRVWKCRMAGRAVLPPQPGLFSWGLDGQVGSSMSERSKFQGRWAETSLSASPEGGWKERGQVLRGGTGCRQQDKYRFI